MPIYVDDMNAKYGRMLMVHMLADSDEELHEMADKIGVNRKWWQAPPKHDSHYDICLSKKAKAVSLGAIEITWRQAGAMNRRRKVTGTLGKPEESEAWLKNYMEQRRKLQESTSLE